MSRLLALALTVFLMQPVSAHGSSWLFDISARADQDAIERAIGWGYHQNMAALPERFFSITPNYRIRGALGEYIRSHSPLISDRILSICTGSPDLCEGALAPHQKDQNPARIDLLPGPFGAWLPYRDNPDGGGLWLLLSKGGALRVDGPEDAVIYLKRGAPSDTPEGRIWAFSHLFGMAVAINNARSNIRPFDFCRHVSGEPFTCQNHPDGFFSSTGMLLRYLADQCDGCSDAARARLYFSAASYLLRCHQQDWARSSARDLMAAHTKSFEREGLLLSQLNRYYRANLAARRP